MRYVPELDGLRAVAVLAVMGYHLSSSVPGGFLGVDVFFVLSGYLITSVLLAEWDRTSGISLPRFYRRRALRLFPALALVLVVVLTLSLLLERPWSNESLNGAPWVILYSSNWRLAFGTPSTLGLFGHTWSLAIEEQFYLVWPLVFIAVIRVKNRKLVAISLCMIASAEVLWRLALWSSGSDGLRVANGLDSHSDGLLIGCALAFHLSRSKRIEPNRWLTTAAAAGFIALVGLFLAMDATTRSASEIGYSVAALCTVMIVWSLVVSPPPLSTKVLASGFGRWVGKRSYGLYLWHPVVFALAAWELGPLTVPLKLAATFLVAAASYRYVEEPFLRRKDGRAPAPSMQGLPSVLTQET